MPQSVVGNRHRSRHVAGEKVMAFTAQYRRDGGYTARVADACVIVPVVNPEGGHPTHGIPSSCSLASSGLASKAAARREQVGVELLDTCG